MKRFIICLLVLLSFATQAQHTAHHDTTKRNTVRINLTPLLVTTRMGSYSVGYERQLFKNQSASANIGQLQLPTIITTAEGDPVHWISNLRNTGFQASLDYRFYFKRNKYAAPDGLYWGPYATYYYFDNKARVELFDNQVFEGSADVQTYLNIMITGVQLGYQFVLGDRWTIDLILFGPGIGFYNLQMNLKGQGEIIGDEEYLQGIYDALVSIYPAVAQLFEEQRITTTGATTFNGAGYRFVVQVGFRF